MQQLLIFQFGTSEASTTYYYISVKKTENMKSTNTSSHSPPHRYAACLTPLSTVSKM